MAPYLHAHVVSPIVRRSSSHWLMWGSLSISFHFLLRPFLLPPPPERDEREKQMKIPPVSAVRRRFARPALTLELGLGLGLMPSAGWRLLYCAASTMPLLSAQHYKVQLKPRGEDAAICYLGAPQPADQRQRRAGPSQQSHLCMRTRMLQSFRERWASVHVQTSTPTPRGASLM